MKKVIILTLLAGLSMLAWGQATSILDENGNDSPLKHKNGNIGIGTTDITERLVLYNPNMLQVSTQYGNLGTGIGLNNGFIVGVESAGNGLVWNRENQFIRFGTNATERIRISANGNVGIGTTSPKEMLEVAGALRVQNQGNGYKKGIFLFTNSLINGDNTGIDFCTSNHQDFIGARIEAERVSGGFSNMNIKTLKNGDVSNNPSSSVYIKHTGQVGIGTTTPSAKLDVNGNIKAHEIEVTLAAMHDLQLNGTLAANNITYTANGNTADFVFEDNYHLKDLSEVEAFIKVNKHLPEIPSATDMEATGVNLAEMNKLLLMKVEELTLYSIEQEKALIDEAAKGKALEERLNKLEELLTNLNIK